MKILVEITIFLIAAHFGDCADIDPDFCFGCCYANFPQPQSVECSDVTCYYECWNITLTKQRNKYPYWYRYTFTGLEAFVHEGQCGCRCFYDREERCGMATGYPPIRQHPITNEDCVRCIDKRLNTAQEGIKPVTQVVSNKRTSECLHCCYTNNIKVPPRVACSNTVCWAKCNMALKIRAKFEGWHGMHLNAVAAVSKRGQCECQCFYSKAKCDKGYYPLLMNPKTQTSCSRCSSSTQVAETNDKTFLCNGKPYDSATNDCCEAHIVRLGHCCNDVFFVPSHMKCCSGYVWEGPHFPSDLVCEYKILPCCHSNHEDFAGNIYSSNCCAFHQLCFDY